jgi:hypothetical protein
MPEGTSSGLVAAGESGAGEEEPVSGEVVAGGGFGSEFLQAVKLNARSEAIRIAIICFIIGGKMQQRLPFPYLLS